MQSLRDLREQCGLGLRELALNIGIDPGTVSRAERGLIGIPHGSAMRWAMELHIDTRRLLLLAAAARVERSRATAAQELARVLTDQSTEEKGKS